MKATHVIFRYLCHKCILQSDNNIGRASWPLLHHRRIVISPRWNYNSNVSSETADVGIKRLDHNKVSQRKLVKAKPVQPVDPRVLKIAVIGAPNAGKSTLANQILGWRFAAVSKKVHTTRERTVGVWTQDDTQVILLDTPGLIDPSARKKHHLELSLLTDPHSAVLEAHLLAVVVDASNPWKRLALEEEILKILHLHPEKRSVLILNKVDLLRGKHELLKVTRILTEGIVDGKESSRNYLKKPKYNLQAILKEKEYEDRNVSEENDKEPSLNLDSDFGISKNGFHWDLYHRRLRKLTHLVKGKKGWPHFERVYMVSALNGDGVQEMKSSFLAMAQEEECRPWEYNENVITDQNPIQVAKFCIWEAMMNNLSREIPYNVKIQLVLWEVDKDSGLLQAVFNLNCKTKRHFHHCLGKQGEKVRKMSIEAKQALMNTFRQDISLWLQVQLKP